MNNNFDMCSYGIGIECNLYHCNGTAFYDFRENFELLTRTRQGDGYTYFYTDRNNLRFKNVIPTKIGDLITLTDEPGDKITSKKLFINVLEVLDEVGASWWYDSKDLVDNWRDNADEVLQEFLNIDIKHFDDVLEFDCCRLKNNIEIYTTRGYSQGDIARVVIDYNNLNEVWGTSIELLKDQTSAKTLTDRKTIYGLREEIDHLFWDCPISGGVTLHYKGEVEDVFLEDIVDDYYTWNKEKAIKNIVEYAKKRIKDLDEKTIEVLEKDLRDLLTEYLHYE
jgi:hypothetical protein